jgi:hypothetical protein
MLDFQRRGLCERAALEVSACLHALQAAEHINGGRRMHLMDSILCPKDTRLTWSKKSIPAEPVRTILLLLAGGTREICGLCPLGLVRLGVPVVHLSLLLKVTNTRV